MKCIKCGSELFPEDTFCFNCGASVSPNTGSSHVEKEKRTCKKCGEVLLDDDVFCANCGASVKEEDKFVSKVEEKPIPKEEKKEEEAPKEPLISMGASKAKPVEERVNPSVPSGDSCKLTLTREKSIIGCAVAYNIFIDGIKVNKIKNGQTLDIPITRGKHTIALSNKKDAVDIVINGDISADVMLMAANHVGITNVRGSGDYSALNRNSDDRYVEKAKKSANVNLAFTGVLPLLSVIWLFLVGGVVSPIVYGIFIGYSIINLAGLKKVSHDPNLYRSLLIKNIIAMVLFIIEGFITILIVI